MVALACSLAAAAAGCRYGPTEVVVALDTDAPATRPVALRVRALRGGASAQDAATDTGELLVRGAAPARDGARAITLPSSLAIVPGAQAARDERVTLVIDVAFPPGGANEPAVAFRRTARFAFVPRARTLQPIFLALSCGAASTECERAPAPGCTVARRCEELGMTCGDQGTCTSIDVVPRPLDPRTDGVDVAAEAARDARAEGGVDADRDADASRDAGADVAGADADAGGPVVVARSTDPFALAADGDAIFWTDFSGGNVWRLPLSGGTPAMLAEAGREVYGMAARAGVVYWAPRFGGVLLSVPAAGGSFARLSDAPGATFVALEGDAVFYASDGSGAAAGVWRVPTSGGGAATQLVPAVAARTLAVRAGVVYYASISDGVIGRVPASGGAATTLAMNEHGVWGLAVDATHLYWANHDRGTIRRVALTGTPAPETLASELGGPHTIALDGATLYWTEDTAGRVVRMAPGTAPVVIASGQNQPKNLILAGGAVYWTNRGGTVMRAER